MNESGYQYQYAGFWIRVVATIIDDVIVMIGSLILGYFAMAVVYFVTKPEASLMDAFTGTQIQLIQFGASLFLSIPYYIGFHYKMGATPGKRMFKIVVKDYQTGGSISLGQSVGRYLGTMLSALTFGIGYLMVAFHPKKRALHEVLSNTVSLIAEPKQTSIVDPALRSEF